MPWVLNQSDFLRSDIVLDGGEIICCYEKSFIHQTIMATVVKLANKIILIVVLDQEKSGKKTAQ